MTEQELKECIAEVKHSAIPEPSKKKIINLLYGQIYKNGWIPCSKCLPENSGRILICQRNGYVSEGRYRTGSGFEFTNLCLCKHVAAWQPLPEAYKPEQQM